MIPTALYDAPEGTRADIPEFFEPSDILMYNLSETLSFTLNKSLWLHDLEFGGHSLAITCYPPAAGLKNIALYHYFWWAFIKHDYHKLKWYNEEQILISDSYTELPVSVLDEHDYGESYTVKCKHFYFTVLFGYNQTLYASHLIAYDAEALMIWMGITMDQRGTSFSAWNLVTSLLAFQMPNVPWPLNVMISIPLFICVAYVIYVLLVKLIPFAGG